MPTNQIIPSTNDPNNIAQRAELIDEWLTKLEATMETLLRFRAFLILARATDSADVGAKQMYELIDRAEDAAGGLQLAIHDQKFEDLERLVSAEAGRRLDSLDAA